MVVTNENVDGKRFKNAHAGVPHSRKRLPDSSCNVFFKSGGK